MTERAPSSSTPKSASPTPEAGTPVIVDVFAKPKPDGTVEFSHEWRWGEGGPSQGKGKIVIPQRRPRDPETPMHFQLKDQTNPKRGFVFSDNQGAAMWVRRDCCPPDRPRSDDSEIPHTEMENHRNLLKVVNINSEECTLHYRLWFRDRDGKLDSYDPEIINGGKGAA